MSAVPTERSRYDLFGVIARRKDVYVELSRAPRVQNRDGRDKPGQTTHESAA